MSYYLKEYEKCIDYSENYSQGLLRSDKEVVEEYKNNCKRKL